jgi:REP element-mobilizing transposase RayT
MNNVLRRRRSLRLREYDYSQAGAYFVTICAYQRKCLFGDIVRGEMRLTRPGMIVQHCWDAIPAHFPNLDLDEFVVMPNHVHGIVLIDDGRGAPCRNPAVEQFGRSMPGSIPTLVRSFKSAATRRVNETRQAHGAKLWQRNYWEHIVRNEPELNRLREYIQNNPAQWDLDNLFSGADDGGEKAR